MFKTSNKGSETETKTADMPTERHGKTTEIAGAQAWSITKRAWKFHEAPVV
jgi:hypothetical protein